METINISEFMSYFISNYFWIVPTFVALATTAVLILDWLYMQLVAWCDDYEKETYEMRFSKYFYTPVQEMVVQIDEGWVVQKGNLYLDLESGCHWRSKKSHWFKDCIVHTERELDSRISRENLRQDDTFNTNIIVNFFLATALLFVFHLLPLAISLSIGLLVSIALLSRTVVRLVKKFNKHINSPDAHKGEEDA